MLETSPRLKFIHIKSRCITSLNNKGEHTFKLPTALA